MTNESSFLDSIDWKEHANFYLKNSNTVGISKKAIKEARISLAKIFVRNNMGAIDRDDEVQLGTLELHAAMFARAFPDEIIAHAIIDHGSNVGGYLSLDVQANLNDLVEMMKDSLIKMDKEAKAREEAGDAQIIPIMPYLNRSD